MALLQKPVLPSDPKEDKRPQRIKCFFLPFIWMDTKIFNFERNSILVVFTVMTSSKPFTNKVKSQRGKRR